MTAHKPEVLFQSWDPSSPALALYVEMESDSEPGKWERVTWGVFDDIVPDAPDNRSMTARAKVITERNDDDGLWVIRVKAIRLSVYSGRNTRVVRDRKLP